MLHIDPKYRWLRADFHNHCERHELLDEYLFGANERLDLLAMSNHGQKPIFREQPEMLTQARKHLAIPMLFGVEWNAPLGNHACVIFPAGDEEARDAFRLMDLCDRGVVGPNANALLGLEMLAGLPTASRPIIIFNHPHGQWSTDAIDQYLAWDTTGHMVVGLEAINGHPAGVQTNPDTYDGCRVGGLLDHVYQQGRPFSVCANSDFHVHKQRQYYDYPLGVFNRTLIGVVKDGDPARGAFEALRQGRTWAVSGDWFTPIAFEVGAASMGEYWDSAASVSEITLSFNTTTPVHAELIGVLQNGDSPCVLRDLGVVDDGDVTLTTNLPRHASGYVRARLQTVSDMRPPLPDGVAGKLATGPSQAYSSAIFFKAGSA